MARLHFRTRVRLRDTDSAGLLFFANQFVYIHDAYEQWLDEIGFPMLQIIEKESFLLPIVHAESDYLRKLAVGDELEIIVGVGEIGNSSFALLYEIITADRASASRARTVHVTIGKKSGRKIRIPGKLLAALTRFKDSS